MDLSMLNEPQRRAVVTTEGPLLVLAGAGSGKTRVLTHRIAYLLEKGVPSYRILALTFTNKAAKEMLERVNLLAGDAAADAWVSTFHSSCARILRRDIEKLGYTRSFTIYDSDDQARLVRDVLTELNLSDKMYPPREVLTKISDAKNHLQSPQEWLQKQQGDFRSQKIADIYTSYESKLKKANALDFDDLLIKTLELFLQHPPVLQSYQDRFDYILVDEYQDTNSAQYRIVQLLAGEKRNLCVVGDDDQSIYGWRGADIHNILDFEKDFPDTTVIKLEQNYRSTGNILDAANQVIAHNVGRKEKALWTSEDAGEPVRLYEAQDERDEAYFLVQQINARIKAGDAPGDMAVLYRVNALSRVVEETLVRAGLKYRVFGGLKFYERKEVKDIVCYLRAVVNPADDVAVKRIINEPRRSIGDTTVQKLSDYAQTNGDSLFAAVLDAGEVGLSGRALKAVEGFGELMTNLVVERQMLPPDEFVRKLLDETGYEEQFKQEQNDENTSRLQNIAEFVGGVVEYVKQNPQGTLDDYLENVALVTDLDRSDDDEGAITLMTMHSAKGLEFKNVFVIGMEEGIFPTTRSIDNDEKLEEERRLCYVAITRARKRLWMTHARQRTLFGRTSMCMPSRFFDELPRRVTEDMNLKTHDTASLMRPRTARGGMGGYDDDYAAPRRTPQYGGYSSGASSYGRSGYQGNRGGYSGSVDAGSGAVKPSEIPGVSRGMAGIVQSRAASVTPTAMLYNIGDRVQHRKFGPGTVVGTSGSGANARVSIEFDDGRTSEFSSSIAPIIKLG